MTLTGGQTPPWGKTHRGELPHLRKSCLSGLHRLSQKSCTAGASILLTHASAPSLMAQWLEALICHASGFCSSPHTLHECRYLHSMWPPRPQACLHGGALDLLDGVSASAENPCCVNRWQAHPIRAWRIWLQCDLFPFSGCLFFLWMIYRLQNELCQLPHMVY